MGLQLYHQQSYYLEHSVNPIYALAMLTKYQIIFYVSWHDYFASLFVEHVAKRLVEEHQVLAHVAFLLKNLEHLNCYWIDFK